MINILIVEFNLIDIWRHFNPNLRQYTRHQKSPKVLSRLDFFLISSNFISNCVNSKIIPSVSSDHSIVTCNFKVNNCPRGPGFWKMNCRFLQTDSDFINHIKEKILEFKEIHENTSCNPNILWDTFKCFISGHCMEYSARKKKERNATKSRLMDEISKLQAQIASDSRDSSLGEKLASLEADLNKIVDFETNGLIIRSRCRWAEEREKSSKYFCNLEKRTCERKKIHRLKNTNGSTIFDNDSILNEIHMFYKHLYSKHGDSKDCSSFLDNIVFPKLSDEKIQILDRPISKNELYRTVLSMKKNKTPGYDGFPIEFYIVFWPDVSDMLVDSYNYSLENGLLSLSQRNGIITLIPKKDKDPLEIKNYKPISLLTTDYKIISKTFANRMKDFLNDLIHLDQSGFLKGRNIGNNVRLLLDLIDYADCNNISGAIVLLDIEKAFDSVHHDFLLEVLKRFKFGENFIKWVKVFLQ